MAVVALGRWACVAATTIGIVAVAGWVGGDVEAVLTWIPGAAPIVPRSAVALALLGISGALRGRRAPGRWVQIAALACAALVLAMALHTVAQYVFGLDVGRDAALIEAPLVGPAPGRPSPLTATAFACLAAGLLLYNARPRAAVRPCEWLIAAGASIALVGVVALILSGEYLARFAQDTVVAVAVPTQIGILLVAIGLLFQRPGVGMMRIARSRGPGGVLFRRVLVPALLAPIAIGVVLTGTFSWFGIEDAPLLGATFGALISITGLALFITAAVPLDRTHASLEAARAQARDVLEQASDAILLLDLDGTVTDANRAACKLLERERKRVVGTQLSELVAADEAADVAPLRERVLGGGTHVVEWRLRRGDGAHVPVEISHKLLSDRRWQAFARDVSARRAAEEVVAREKAKAEGIITLAAEAIISVDAEQRITLFNRAAEKIFGWPAAEVMSQPLELLIPERFRERHRERVRRFAEDPAPSRPMSDRPGAIIGLRKDGTEFVAEAAISKLCVDTQLTFTVVLRDVTEQRQLERELRDARAFLENVLESSTEYGIIALDRERDIILWNQGASRTYGYAAREVIGRSVDVLHAPGTVASGVAGAMFARADDEALAEEVVQQRRADGSAFTAHVTVSRRTGEDGAPLGYLLISRDVTAEQQRSEHEHLLSALGPKLAVSLDRTMVVEAALGLVTERLADACIVDLAEIPEQPHAKRRCHGAHRDPRKRALVEAIARAPIDRSAPHLTSTTLETGRTSVLTHVTPDYLAAQPQDYRELVAELAPVSLITAPLRARGLMLGAIALISSDRQHRFRAGDVPFIDELARRIALAADNARLFESERAATAARDAMMGIVAHDLRNPLNAVLLATGALVRAEGERRAATVQLATRMQRSIERANRLIEDLLDVAQIESNQMLTVTQRALAIDELVEEVRELVGAAAERAGIELEVAIAPGLPRVWGDAARLLQVLENLASNAIKFTPAGGRISIAARRRDSDVAVTVEDTGPGIPADQLSHLFEPFWQADRRDRRGAGLGLAIARGIIDAHGGRIWAESEPGRGSRFTFTVPIVPAAGAAARVPLAHGRLNR